MDNQHRKIKGYRELSQAEIDLMNEIKTKGVEFEALLLKIDAHLIDQTRLVDQDEKERLAKAQSFRWAAIGRTHLQEGLMSLTRSIAQPTFF